MVQPSEATPETTSAGNAPSEGDGTPEANSGRGSGRARRGSGLTTEQGKTTIADSVVAKIASMAAREVPGVHQLNTQGASGLMSGLSARMTGGDAEAAGVNVEVGEREAAIDLAMTVDYGVSIEQVADAVRRNVINRVQSMTGLVVNEVNIGVTDLFFPEEAGGSTSERRVE